jgi:error-prone DNA polymerase
VLPVDVNHSEWDCTLEQADERETDGATSAAARGSRGRRQPAIRLGLRMVKGLSRVAGDAIVEARRAESFSDMQSLAERARLDQKALQSLAASGALAPLSGNRHQARWAVAGVEESVPLELPAAPEAVPLLRTPGVGEDVAADYGSVGFSLRAHPLSLLRERLQRRGVVTGEELSQRMHGSAVRVAGLVISRQRPATASGVTFVTLEDETGSINLVVWPSIAQAQRRELLGARLLCVIGNVQREGEVLHVVARRLEDYSGMLGGTGGAFPRFPLTSCGLPAVNGQAGTGASANGGGPDGPPGMPAQARSTPPPRALRVPGVR